MGIVRPTTSTANPRVIAGATQGYSRAIDVRRSISLTLAAALRFPGSTATLAAYLLELDPDGAPVGDAWMDERHLRDDDHDGDRLFSRSTADGHRIDFGLSVQPWRERPRYIGWATLATLLVFGAIACFSGVFGTLLQRSARAQTALNRVAGLVFLGLAVRLATSQR